MSSTVTSHPHHTHASLFGCRTRGPLLAPQMEPRAPNRCPTLPAAGLTASSSRSAPIIRTAASLRACLPGALAASGLLVGPLLHPGGGRPLLRRVVVLLLTLELLRVAPEERVDHHVPWVGAGHGAPEVEHLPGEEPVEQRDRLLALVVRGDGDVHMLQGRVRVAKGHDRDAGVRGLPDRLSVRAGIRHDQEAGLQILLRDLIRERARHPAARHGVGPRVLAELQDCTRAVGTLRRDDDVRRVLDSDDHASGDHQLLPRLSKVHDVDTIVNGAAEDVALHAVVAVAGAQVDLTYEHLLDIILLGLRHCASVHYKTAKEGWRKN